MQITKDYFTGKKVLIFGFGTNGGGSGTLDFLLTTDVHHVTITDQKPLAELGISNTTLLNHSKISWHCGGHTEKDFEEADIVIKNPGIRWDHPLVVLAQQNGAEVVMDSTLFMALCPAPVIGVTGSKGKTSTASLIAHVLETAGREVVRVGISQTGVLSELPKITEENVVVFELSSWRLSGLREIQKSPHVSILTNLYPDHLNYYGDMEEYARDKKVITDFQTPADFFILPSDNEWTQFFTQDTKANIKTFSQKNKGYFESNMEAATLALETFGIAKSDIEKSLLSFRGVPHRFELVREIGGVKYINDTAATIPSAALASVQSVQGPVILLAGGSDKNLPLEDLLTAIGISKHTFLFKGSGTDKILQKLSSENQQKITVVKNMEEAVTKAHLVSAPADTVLLAPGAASFGMFTNEFDRGEQFIQTVTNLTE